MRLIHRLRVHFPIAVLAPLMVLIAFSVMRFDQSLWADEASSVWFARQPIGTLLTAVCDPHPPGYYALLKFWLLFGDSEAWLRVPSLLASLGSLIILYRLTRDRFGRSAATLAAWLLALQPLVSWYASEVRMYALVTFAGLSAVWVGWRLIDGQAERRHWIAYALLVQALVWVDYTAVLPLLLLQLIWVARGCPQPRRWISLHMVSAIPIGGWLLASNQLSSLGRGYQPVFIAIQAARFGLTLTPEAAARLLQLLTGLALIAGLGLALYARRTNCLAARWQRGVIMAGWFGVLIFAALPLLFTFKRLVVVIVPYAVLSAAVVMARWPRSRQLVVVGVSLVAALFALITFQREAWRPLVQQIAREQNAVIWVDDLAVPAFDYYWRRFGAGNEARWTPLLSRDLPLLPALTPSSNGTLLLVTGESEYRHLIALLPQAFWADYAPMSNRRWDDLVVYQYQRRLQPDPTARPPLERTAADGWGLLLPSPLGTCE